MGLLGKIFGKQETKTEPKKVLKRDTRHFAKRQITWFKRERQVEWFDKQDFGYDAQVILDAMLASLREKKIIR